jgi:hypothetical protein
LEYVVRYRNFLAAFVGCISISVGALAQTPKSSQTAPTCESISRAIAAAHGPIGPVEDRTAQSQKLATEGTLPYAILRMCVVTIPGQRLPIRVAIHGASHQFFVKMMSQMAAVRGHGIRKLDGASYGDLAYLLPQDAGGYAVDAAVGDMGLNIAYMPNDRDIENMAEHVIKLMR